MTCGTCHKIDQTRGTIGPDISSGSVLTISDIITEVLWRYANLKEGYNTVMISMKNGETIQGVKAFETGTVVTLKGTAGGQPHAIEKSAIADITELGSVMPEGLTNNLSKLI